MVSAGHEVYSHGLKGHSCLDLSLLFPEFGLERDKSACVVPYCLGGEAVLGWLSRLQGAVAFLGHSLHRRPCVLVGRESSTDDLQNVCLVARGMAQVLKAMPTAKRMCARVWSRESEDGGVLKVREQARC